jgi:hypothetical protein
MELKMEFVSMQNDILPFSSKCPEGYDHCRNSESGPDEGVMCCGYLFQEDWGRGIIEYSYPVLFEIRTIKEILNEVTSVNL